MFIIRKFSKNGGYVALNSDYFYTMDLSKARKFKTYEEALSYNLEKGGMGEIVELPNLRE